ncbi:MMPL family transporter [Actinocorallia sp. API 0066]|uniref:MMPL family transporter n=1 Tax=Actinocorallia sp. API 0066 TaxID=2896846 RepID=UPI00271481C8|nr:MMPL family transporter [Actinocorallia sp. API 0066]
MPAWLKRLSPGDRRGTWIVLGAWILLAVLLGPLAGRLEQVEEDGPNAFLPGNAESAQVNLLLADFRQDDAMPAVIVYTGPKDVITERAEADRPAFSRVSGTETGPPVTSDDGKAVIVVVPLHDSERLGDSIDELRALTKAGVPPGVTIEVGGPAATLMDAVAVFDSLDSTLMLATGTVVIVLLLLTYRSPFLWLVPVLSVAFAAVLTQATTYLLAAHAGLPVNPQSAGILMVLVFGVGTDYALLLIARYREELHAHEDRHAAMRLALRRSVPAILASAGTVVLGLCCLAFADLNSSRSLGLVGAVGIACAFLAMVSVLPALLVLGGRWIFWPFVPRFGDAPRRGTTGWRRIGDLVARRPRAAWLGSLAVTGGLALGVVGMDLGLEHAEMFQDKPGSVIAQERIAEHFPSGAADPAVVVVPDGDADAAVRAASGVPGVVSATAGDSVGGRTQLAVVLADAPDSAAAKGTIDGLRDALPAAALVGGSTAEELDTERATARDLRVVVPLVLLVVVAVLVGLLRAVLGPLLLLCTVVVSFLAALGASNLLFVHVFGHAAVDWEVPLLGFVFLVALGIDYNIFLMHRVREESARHGHARGVVVGLAGTGGVITSAGIVLAATFAVFAVLPMVTMMQLGVIVSLGVLLETLLIRTILVPALALDLGPRFWWPNPPTGPAADPTRPEVVKVA